MEVGLNARVPESVDPETVPPVIVPLFVIVFPEGMVSPELVHLLPSGKVSVPLVPNINPEESQADPSGKDRLVPVPKIKPVDFQTDPSAKLITEPVLKSSIPDEPKVTVLLNSEGAFPLKTDPLVPFLPVNQRFVPSYSRALGTVGDTRGEGGMIMKGLGTAGTPPHPEQGGDGTS